MGQPVKVVDVAFGIRAPADWRPVIAILGLLAAAPVLGAPAKQAPPAGPPIVGLRIGPIGAEKMDVALLLAPSVAEKCTGKFRGSLTFYDAPPGAALEGTLSPGAGGCELAGSVSWEALSGEAIGKARADVLTVRVQGERVDGGKARKVDWGAAVPRAAVSLTESMKVTLRRFTKAPEIHLGGLGMTTTTVNADVEVLSPLRFNLKVVEARCEVEVNGRAVASGVREKFLVYGGRTNRIQIPIAVNNGAALAAAGSTLMKGGKVDGKLTGLARLRLSGGDVDFPIEFPVKLSLR